MRIEQNPAARTRVERDGAYRSLAGRRARFGGLPHGGTSVRTHSSHLRRREKSPSNSGVRTAYCHSTANRRASRAKLGLTQGRAVGPAEALAKLEARKAEVTDIGPEADL